MEDLKTAEEKYLVGHEEIKARDLAARQAAKAAWEASLGPNHTIVVAEGEDIASVLTRNGWTWRDEVDLILAHPGLDSPYIKKPCRLFYHQGKLVGYGEIERCSPQGGLPLQPGGKTYMLFLRRAGG